MNLSKLCTPAMLYLVVSFIALILAYIGKFNLSAIVVKVIFIALWTWFLNFLCKKGFTSISWFLVLLPYVFIVLTMLLALEVVKRSGKEGMAHITNPAMKRK
jgi:ABC-type uncharacterized transport system permease subunit